MDIAGRRTGIDAVGQVPWGTHFCQFYRNRADLLDILVPYFRGGLEDNEYCMWITSEPLDASDALHSLTETIPNFSQYLDKRQIEILPHTEWYLEGGSFDQRRVLARWLDKLNQALAMGYSGLRLSGNTFWLEKENWQSFSDYEAAVNDVLGQHNILALCTYSLDKCSALEIVEVVCNHEFALVCKEGHWELFESALYKRTKEALADEGSQRFRGLFENVPVALYEEDWSEVKRYLDSLRSQGMEDFWSYFADNPDAVARCAELVRIVDVNQAALTLYEAETKDELLKGLRQIFAQESYALFAEELATLAGGTRRFQGERLTRTLKGKPNYVYLTLSVAPGHEETWARVLLSISDITARKETEAKLRSSREYLEKLNNSLQEVIFTVRFPERVIVYVNDSVKTVFGYEPEECTDQSTVFLHESKDAYTHFGSNLKNAIAEGKEVYAAEHLMKRKDGHIFPAEITCTFLREDGAITQVITVLRDISRRKQAEEQLRQSQSSLAEAQRIARLGNWTWDIEKNELLWSDEIYDIFGLTFDRFGATYDSFLESVHPEDRRLVTDAVDAALYERKPYSIDHRVLRPDGSVRFVHEQGEVSYNEDHGPVRMIGTVHDITERKMAEDQLRELSRRLIKAQEDERLHLARELHDEIGQQLTSLKLLLARTERAEIDRPVELEQAQEILGDLIGRVRNLSLTLSPSMLVDLGLLPTLQWYFKTYSALTGTKVFFKQAGLRRSLPHAIALAAYRTIQEALTNVARHARTGEVMVCIRGRADVLRIEVEDHGAGFDASAFDKPTAGLVGMRERVNALEGTFEVSSSPGVGTYLLIEFPLPRATKASKKKGGDKKKR